MKKLAVVLCAFAFPLLAAAAQETFSYGRFGTITVYRPDDKPPTSVVLFLSGDGGWNLGVARMAQALVQRGALVAGLDSVHYRAELRNSGDSCVYPNGDLENLSHFIQAYYRVPTYLQPILMGYSSGATLTYATLAQSPKDLFLGGVSLGFCPDLDLSKPLCQGSGVEFTPRKDGKGVNFLPARKLQAPWIALQGGIDRVCPPARTQEFAGRIQNAEVVMLPKVGHGFAVEKNWMPQYLAAFDKLAARRPPEKNPVPESLSDLPLVEVAPKGSSDADLFAILITGDGGWAGLDKEVAAGLAAQGMPVVGVDSLRYFWTPRTPESTTADLDRVIRYYREHWRKTRVIVLGYSQGADVLPFIYNRLPVATRHHVALTVTIGLSETALFEFHLSNWLGQPPDGVPTLPEIHKLAGTPLLCIYGQDDKDSLCPTLNPNQFRVVALPGGHHFGGNYEALAKAILKEVPESR